MTADLASFLVSIDGTSVSEIARDIVVALSAAAVAMAGIKGLNRLLLEEDMKLKAREIRLANKASSLKAREIINTLSDYENDGILRQEDLDYLNDLCSSLYIKAQEGSTLVCTNAFFAKYLFKGLYAGPHETETYAVFNLSVRETIGLLIDICNLIAFEAETNVYIPEAKSQKLRKPRVFRYYVDVHSKRISAGGSSLNLMPNSSIAFEFYCLIANRLRGIQRQYFNKTFFDLLRSHYPAINFLRYPGKYFPPILKRLDESGLKVDFHFLGAEQGVDSSGRDIWKCFYAPIGIPVKFKPEKSLPKLVFEQYVDPIFGNRKAGWIFDGALVWPDNIVQLSILDTRVESLSIVKRWYINRWLSLERK